MSKKGGFFLKNFDAVSDFGFYENVMRFTLYFISCVIKSITISKGIHLLYLFSVSDVALGLVVKFILKK